ncbi:MAG TPA: hypothetical protein PLS23_00315 [Phycisphaerae bacterium]|nr:hypothetical protein [Phycisphaerae bacterium]
MLNRPIVTRIVLIFGAAGFAVLLGGLSTWWYLGRKGTSDLENWIGRQIVGILQHHITPQVRFENLDYQAPRTVIVENLSFTAEDRPILRVARARLELAAIPQRGKPILIQDVQLEAPQVLLAHTANEGLLGWTNFVRKQAIEHPETVPEGQRLSDVLVLRHVGIHNGEVVYEDAAANRMTLPGINLNLETPPDEQEPGWYRLIGRLNRDPILDLDFDGRINLDTGLLEIARFQLAASLSEPQYETVPPALQAFLRRHEVQGALTASGQGQIPLAEPARASGRFDARLQDARVRHRGTAMPIQSIQVAAQLPDGDIDVSLTGLDLTQENEAFFSLQSVRARIAGLPRGDEPLTISLLRVEQPRLTFASRPGGGLEGWSDVAEMGDRRERASTDPSQVLQAIRLAAFEISDGAVVYQPAGDEPVALEGIHVNLTTQDGEGDGSLDVAGSLQVAGLLQADLRGTLDPNAAVLTLERFEAGADIQPEDYDRLPAATRDWIARHEVRGRVTATGEGRLPLGDIAQAQFTLGTQLEAARFMYRGILTSLGQARAQLTLPQRRIEATASEFQAAADDQPMLAFDQLTATLQFPENGPVVLEQLVVDQPQLTLAAGADGGLAGWKRLQGTPASDPQEDSPTRAALPLRIRDVQVRHGSLTYIPEPDAEPFSLGHVDLQLRPADTGEPHLLLMNGSIAEDWLSVEANGRIDLDARSVEIDKLGVRSDIAPERYAQLPPALREIVSPLKFAGKVSVTASGTVPIDAPATASGTLQAEIDSASVTVEGMRIPVSAARLNATLPNGPLAFAARDLAVWRGEQQLARTDSVFLQSRQLPRGSTPVVVDLLRFEGPAISLVQRPDGGFAGWSDLGGGPTETRPAQEAAAQNAGLRVNRLEVARGELTYASPAVEPPLAVQEIEALLVTEPADQPDEMRFSGQIRQPQALSLDFNGTYDRRRPALTFSKLTAQAEINDAVLANLPAEMRESLRQHQVRGHFEIDWQGSVPLGEQAGEPAGRFNIAARSASLTYRGVVWPLGDLQVKGEWPKGPIDVRGTGVSAKADGQEILSLAAIEARIAQLGTDGQPLRVERLSLQSPRVVLASNEGGFLGWSRFGGGDAPNGQPGQPPADAPRPVFDRVQIRGGELVYVAGPGQPTMALPGIHADVTHEPEPAPTYLIAARLGDPRSRDGQQPPDTQQSLHGQLNARYSPDADIIDVQTLQLRANLRGPQYPGLPPQVQAFLSEHAVRGAISLDAQGRVPLNDPSDLQGRLTAAARDVYFAVGQTRWPVSQLDATADANRGIIQSRVNASMVGGRVQANSTLSLPEGGIFNLDWQITGVQLEQIMQAMEETTRHAGLVNSRGRVTGRLGQLPQTLSGNGELTIREGRLLRIPIIQGIVGRLISTPLGLRGREDRAEANWQFQSDGVNFSKLTVTSPLLGLDGRGLIAYGGELNMNFRAELLQRIPDAIEGALGRVGSIIGEVGRIGGSIVTYRVTGTIQEPRILPDPLGISGN